MSRSTTNKDTVAAVLRREQALALRIVGKTYGQIGTTLGCSRKTAHKSVVRALDESRARTGALADRHRELELARLDRAIRKTMAIMNGRNTSDAVALRAAGTLARIVDGRAKLLGLYLPDAWADQAAEDEERLAPEVALAGLVKKATTDELVVMLDLFRRIRDRDGPPDDPWIIRPALPDASPEQELARA